MSKYIFDIKNLYILGDTHFFHNNIIKYCNRLDPNTGQQFVSVDRMNEVMIENWNKKIPKNAKVIHLGDIAMGGKSRGDALYDILSNLNGELYHVRGNHDDYLFQHEGCKSRFVWSKDYAEVKLSGYDRNISLILSHFPFLTWNNAGRDGTYHLHGHSHGSVNHMNEGTTRFDVGVDNNNLTPFSAVEIVDKLKNVKYTPVDHHGENTSYH